MGRLALAMTTRAAWAADSAVAHSVPRHFESGRIGFASGPSVDSKSETNYGFHRRYRRLRGLAHAFERDFGTATAFIQCGLRGFDAPH